MMGGSSRKFLEYGVMALDDKEKEWLKRSLTSLAVRYWAQTLALLRDQGIEIRLTKDSALSVATLGLGWVKYHSRGYCSTFIRQF